MGKLEKLLKRAVKVRREIDQLEKNPKLTAESFIRGSMKIARTTHDALDKIESILEERPETHTATHAFLRRARNFIESSHCCSTTNEIRRLRWLTNQDCDAEFSALKTNLFEAFSLAVRQSAKKHPKAFGNISDWDKHQQDFSDLEDSYRKICAEIEESYEASDLDFDTPDKNDRVKATFQISNGEIAIGHEAGKRLVEWSMKQTVSL